MESISAGETRFVIATAIESDLPEIVELLTDDALGADRETADLEPYRPAFRQIEADDLNLLVVVRTERVNELVGTMQLTLIPGLARAGATRLQIEAVRVVQSARGCGLGAAMIKWGHEYGRARGAELAQLTSDKSRLDAHHFYERLGYVATHEGFKRSL